MLRVGVIGYGYWGPNIVRNFNLTPGARVVAVCDKNPAVIKGICRDCPHQRVVTEPDDIIKAPDVDLVAIVTPVRTHYDLARRALENGKHVLVEKPLTATVAQAEALREIAAARGLFVGVDHTFVFTGAVRKIKEILDNGVLGEVYYYDSTRVNLGLFQHDVNVIWDLAPHDFSILSFLFPETPVAISAYGMSHVNGHEDVAYIGVHYDSKLIAHFNVNWLSPVKVRNTLIGGDKRMLLWNDLVPDEKVKVYDKGIDVTTREGVYEQLVSYRTGDMWAPRIDVTEALSLECAHCVDCIEHGVAPLNGIEEGIRVVRMLEACDRSLRNNGSTVEIDAREMAI